MNAVTKRLALSLCALALVVGAPIAWALPPCTLCAYLPVGYPCTGPTGELDHCPAHFQVQADAMTLEDFLQQLEAPTGVDTLVATPETSL
jgi:hypothetical protein